MFKSYIHEIFEKSASWARGGTSHGTRGLRGPMGLKDPGVPRPGPQGTRASRTLGSQGLGLKGPMGLKDPGPMGPMGPMGPIQINPITPL